MDYPTEMTNDRTTTVCARVAACVHVCVCLQADQGCDVAESSYQVHAWRGEAARSCSQKHHKYI